MGLGSIQLGGHGGPNGSLGESTWPRETNPELEGNIEDMLREGEEC
jgi:hypothetical protein